MSRTVAPKGQKFTFSMIEVVLYSIPFMLPAAVFAGAFITLFGVDALFAPLQTTPLLLLLLIGVGLLIAHEGIHALAWLIAGRLRHRDIKFGFHMMSLTPYAHARVPMRADAYRWGAAAPTIVLGVLPGAIALVTGNGALGLIASVMLAAGCGDLLIIWNLGSVPNHWLVQDHASEAGCMVYPPAPSVVTD
jgi:hypothetical protein